MGAKLGDRVVYHAHEAHHTETVKTDPSTNKPTVTHGSNAHHECRSFSGTVGRVHADGTADILFFPPNREPKWADRVHEGEPAPQLAAVQPKPAPEGEKQPEPIMELPDYFEVLS